ncbi:phytanoyl-CoA dioxygenase, peroxisomal-like isoform X2 [Bacillus rossius redtenbacheri]|uniref:phytanoyl-CoA dioxygenase, peroxisomal-like isoform X2 n=1 Tax=Bacillus rossius redtenbacheri TaxID=93214 RepID=UPI002FDE602E
MASERNQVTMKHLKGNQEHKLTPHETSASVSSGACEFRYTLDGEVMSHGERRFYEDNGYLLVRGLVEHALLDECCRRFVDVCEGRVPRSNMVLMKDKSLLATEAAGEKLYYKLQDIVWDDVFSKYILHPRVLDYVECFTGPNVKAVHTMLINKPPDSGKMTSIHPLHQDLHYFPFRPADRIVAAWTAMERVTVDNGCLVVIPGTHKGKLEPHDYPDYENGVNKAFHGVKGFENHPLLPLEMEKGDTVFFHPILVHGSGINTTKGFRKAISCHYAASECHYIDVKGTTQENIAKEVEELALRKGFDLDFQTLWKLRMRLARGRELSRL